MRSFVGGIDLGGTKIEARLFADKHLDTVEINRIPTPVNAYSDLLDALIDQVNWLRNQARTDSIIPIGIAVPGIVDSTSGKIFATNLPVSEQHLATDLKNRLQQTIALVNDGMAFTLSEAMGGAAEMHRSVMGLVLGTGVGGGLCIDKTFPHRQHNLAVELGHTGLAARAVKRHDLPLWLCGCGRVACVESYISGTGLTNLTEHLFGSRATMDSLADEQQEELLTVWADLTGECLASMQLLLDPDCVVLGGGVSNIPLATKRLSAALADHLLDNLRLPDILLAKHGDSSGSRGAALVASHG